MEHLKNQKMKIVNGYEAKDKGINCKYRLNYPAMNDKVMLSSGIC